MELRNAVGWIFKFCERVGRAVTIERKSIDGFEAVLAKKYPTGPFTISEPQNQEIVELYILIKYVVRRI